jgi:hypothetical protein
MLEQRSRTISVYGFWPGVFPVGPVGQETGAACAGGAAVQGLGRSGTVTPAGNMNFPDWRHRHVGAAPACTASGPLGLGGGDGGRRAAWHHLVGIGEGVEVQGFFHRS